MRFAASLADSSGFAVMTVRVQICATDMTFPFLKHRHDLSLLKNLEIALLLNMGKKYARLRCQDEMTNLQTIGWFFVRLAFPRGVAAGYDKMSVNRTL
jgi:hypothetical protein